MIIGWPDDERGHGQTNQLYDINWGALDHASRAPQLMLCNYMHAEFKSTIYRYILVFCYKPLTLSE